MNSSCIYTQVMLQMYLNDLNCRELSARTGIAYPTLRRKLRGESDFLLAEALRVKAVLNVPMTLEELFRKRGETA